MSLAYLLDTCVFSQPIRTNPDQSILEQWHRLHRGALCTSSICLLETLRGLHLRNSKKMWMRYKNHLEGRYKILPFGESEAALFTELEIMFRKTGKPKSEVDLMIATVAMTNNLILVTENTADFEGIPNLHIDSWSK